MSAMAATWNISIRSKDGKLLDQSENLSADLNEPIQNNRELTIQ